MWQTGHVFESEKSWLLEVEREMGIEDIEADDDDEGGGADGDKKAGEEDGENIPDADADIFRRL